MSHPCTRSPAASQEVAAHPPTPASSPNTPSMFEPSRARANIAHRNGRPDRPEFERDNVLLIPAIVIDVAAARCAGASAACASPPARPALPVASAKEHELASELHVQVRLHVAPSLAREPPTQPLGTLLSAAGAAVHLNNAGPSFHAASRRTASHGLDERAHAQPVAWQVTHPRARIDPRCSQASDEPRHAKAPVSGWVAPEDALTQRLRGLGRVQHTPDTQSSWTSLAEPHAAAPTPVQAPARPKPGAPVCEAPMSAVPWPPPAARALRAPAPAAPTRRGPAAPPPVQPAGASTEVRRSPRFAMPARNALEHGWQRRAFRDRPAAAATPPQAGAEAWDVRSWRSACRPQQPQLRAAPAASGSLRFASRQPTVSRTRTLPAVSVRSHRWRLLLRAATCLWIAALALGSMLLAYEITATALAHQGSTRVPECRPH